MKLASFFYNLFDQDSKLCRNITKASVSVLGAVTLFIALLFLWQILGEL